MFGWKVYEDCRVERGAMATESRCRMLLQKKWLLLLALVMFTAGLTSCRERSSSQQQQVLRPFEGTVVHIAVPAGLGLPERWKLLLDEWSEQTGGKVEFTELPLSPGQDLTDKIVEQLKQADLIVFPLQDITAYAEKGLIGSLPESELAVGRLDWNDIFRGLRLSVGNLEQHPSVVPLACPTLVVYYRADLLEKAIGRPPRTWQDYQRLVVGMADWAPGLVAVEPWHPEFRATLFLAKAVAYAQHPGNYSLFFDIFTGKPLIDHPAFVRALQESIELLKSMPKEVKHYTPADCRKAILEGRAALAISFEPCASGAPLVFTPFDAQHSSQNTKTKSDQPTAAKPNRSEDTPSPAPTTPANPRPEKLRLGFCPLPGSKQVYNNSIKKWESPPEQTINNCVLVGFGGLCAGVPPQRNELVRRAACHLLTRLTLERVNEALPENCRSLCRESQVALAAQWVGPELTAEEKLQFTECVANMFRTEPVVALLPVVGRERFLAALNKGIETALNGSKSPQQALKDVAEEWNRIVSEIGADKVRDSYRRRLGLPPRAVHRSQKL